MKIEQQVVSLELAKKLKKAGYPQNDSLWYWMNPRGSKYWHLELNPTEELREASIEIIAAPTVAELGEKLPFGVVSEKQIGIPSLGWRVTFEIPTQTQLTHSEEAETEADARCLMWLYLKKEGLIK